MTAIGGRLVALLFAALVVATFGAFFIAQRIKQRPPVLSSVTFPRFFSPNDNGVRDQARISFGLREADTTEVEVVDLNGDLVRRLDAQREVGAEDVVRLRWNGRDDEGQVVPDGRYRLRFVLRDQGRSVTVPRSIQVDTTPPQPSVARVQPAVISPDGDGRADSATIDYRGPTQSSGAGTPPELIVYRTGRFRAQPVHRIQGEAGRHRYEWDGRIDGRPAPPGNYLIGVRVRDAAGNTGSSPEVLPPRRSAETRGSPGVRVRYIEARPPERAVTAGERAPFLVDTDRRQRYRYAITRLGHAEPERRGRSRARDGTPLRPRVPERPGVYVLELSYGQHRYRTPFVVRSRQGREPLLVVLPAISWQGTNVVDTTGDGWGETLATDGAVRLDRAIGGTGLPRGLETELRPVLRLLTGERIEHDLTTDLALARGEGRTPDQYQGVLLLGDMRFFPAPQRRRLRAAVEAGTRIGWLGTDALHRDVRVGEGHLRRRGPRVSTDPFGERTEVERLPEARPLEAGADAISLFAEVLPSYGAFDSIERSIELPEGSRLLAGSGPAEGGLATPVYRLGRGIVARVNPQGIAPAVATDDDVERVVRRMARLLARH